MHVVEITHENPLNLANGRYLAEDVNSGEMLSRGWCTVESAKEKVEIRKLNPEEDYNGKKILFVRPGGLGDLLFLTPTFAEIKRLWPEAQIYVSCFERYRDALENNPDVAGFIPYPTPLRKPDATSRCWEDFDAHVWCENLIEENEEARTIHAVELAAQRAGIVLPANDANSRKMRYFVTEEERAKAESEFPNNRQCGSHRIGLQMSSGQPRAYPHMQTVSKTLWKAGNEVFLFGRPKELKTNEPPGIVNLMLREKTFRESCAILSTCDVMVVPDSALCHVAGALMRRSQTSEVGGQPDLSDVRSLTSDLWTHAPVACVALYGPFPWHLRTAHAKGTFALQGRCPVSPCFHHVRPGKGVFPSFGPCATSGTCEALESIEPERVVRAVEKMLEAIRGQKSEDSGQWEQKRDAAISKLESVI